MTATTNNDTEVHEDWITDDTDDVENITFDAEGYVEDDGDIRFSIGRDKFDNTPLQVSIPGTTNELYKFVEVHRSNKKGEHYICAPLLRMEHQRQPEKFPGMHFFRQKAGVRAIKLAMFDWDGLCCLEVAYRIFDFLSAKFAGVWYETASHTPEHPRARAVLILDRYVNAEEQMLLSLVIQHDIETAVDAEALRQAYGETALKFDQSVYRPIQPVYLPLQGAQMHRLNGEPVDVDATLARAPEEILAVVKGNGAKAQCGRGLPGDLHTLVDSLYGDMSNPLTVEQLRRALNFLDPRMGRDPWRSVIFGLADAYRRGVTDAHQWAHEWSQRCPEKYNPQDLDRLWSDFDPQGGVHAETIYWMAQQQGWKPSGPAGSDDPEEVVHEARARAGSIRAQLDRLAGEKLVLPSDYYDHGEASRKIFEVIAKTFTLFNRGGVVVEWAG